MGNRPPPNPARRDATIRQIVEDALDQRAEGRDIDDEQIIAEHPGLAPELAAELRLLRVLERARVESSIASTRMQSESGWAGDSGRSAPEGKTPPPASSDLPCFPGYTTVRVIDRGGQGIVYEAIQDRTERRVALKIMRDAALGVGAADIGRFMREVRVLAHLDHPNIVRILSSGVEQGHAYFVMDFIDGQALDLYLAASSPPIRDRVVLLAKICDAVNAAHLRGVIHRDLKPTNVLVDDSGEPHVLDFGLAGLTDEFAGNATIAESMTQTGQFLGSLPWASPEQIRGGSSTADLRTDVYSLGLLLFMALTGTKPHSSVGSTEQVLQSIMSTPPQRPSKFSRGIDPDLDTIAVKCLSKEPQERYQSAGALADDLRAYLNGRPIVARSPGAVRQIRAFIRRNRALAAGVGAVVVALMMGMAATLRENTRARRSEAVAQSESRTYERINRFYADTFRLLDPSDSLKGVYSRSQDQQNVVDLLLDAAKRVPVEFMDRPDLAAQVDARVGRGLVWNSRPQDAVATLSAGLERARAALGADARATLEVEVVLVRALATSNERLQALTLGLDAYERTARTLRADDPLRLRAAIAARWVLPRHKEHSSRDQLDCAILSMIGEGVDESKPVFIEALVSYTQSLIFDAPPRIFDSLSLPALGLSRRLDPPDNYFSDLALSNLVIGRVARRGGSTTRLEAEDALSRMESATFDGEKVKKWIVDDLVNAGQPRLALVLAEGMLARVHRLSPQDNSRISAAQHLVEGVREAGR